MIITQNSGNYSCLSSGLYIIPEETCYGKCNTGRKSIQMEPVY